MDLRQAIKAFSFAPLSYPLAIAFLVFSLVFYVTTSALSFAQDFERSGVEKFHFGGRLKLAGAITWHKDDTIFDVAGTGPCLDGNGELRLTNEAYFSRSLGLEIHYQAIWQGGDTLERTRNLQDLFGDLLPSSILATHIDDQGRLFDLTRVIHKSDRSILYHRLDRLNFSLVKRWGSIRLGRQGITWGNGLIFNPMDVFNPFPPAAIDKAYKVGDDMANLEIAMGSTGNLQVLYIPRRDPKSDDISFDHSSLAGKVHFSTGMTELDFMGAWHYKDKLAGIGGRGYVGQAAWRGDIIYTRQDDGDDYLSVVVNMDYSWTWLGHNVYGMLEYFHSGIGKKDYGDAMLAQEIKERVGRGELFVLGRDYMSALAQVELHPLVNFYLTIITNIRDPSGIIQPRLTWDATQNLQLVTGITAEWGNSSSEFGGFTIPGTNVRAPSDNRLFLWLLYYF
jgi:hypothetical protein